MLASTLQRRAGVQSTNDYNRHRNYATHRIRKLRSRAQLSLRPKANARPKPLEDPKHWPIAVLLAERDWAAAMEVKSALDADAAAASASAQSRAHMLSKLAKAIKYAAHAAQLAKPVLAGREQLEVEVYIALLQGDAALEKQQWDTVAAAYSRARVGLVALGNEEVFTDYVSAKVDPVLKLAFAQVSQARSTSIPHAAQLRVAGTPASSAFVELVRSVDASALDSGDKIDPAKQLGEIKFRSHTAEVRDADLAQAVLDAQATDKQLDAQLAAQGPALDPASFDAVLGSWQDAASIVADILSAGRSHEEHGDGQQLHIVNTYIQFHLLYRRIQRDNEVASKERAGNAARIYDALLQSCEAMAELPGVFSDDELTQSIEGMQLYFKTLRTLAVAETHRTGSREVLALLNLAHKRLQASQTVISADLPVHTEQLEDLKELVAQRLSATHGLTVVFEEAARRSAMRGSIASDVRAFPVAQSGGKLVVADLECKTLEPVPVKPVFYDIAYNYVKSDDGAGEGPAEPTVREASVESTGSQSGKKKLFGLF